MNEDRTDLQGLAPESWSCIDCGINTAPGWPNREELKKAIVARKAAGEWKGLDTAIDLTLPPLSNRAEVYTVRDTVWKSARMEPSGGCLCVGCLEKRLGRRLKPKDFDNHAFNYPWMPASPRLRNRR
jgi:hypothetical protein